MITINSNVRFATEARLKAQARQANFIGFEQARDDRGFYFTAVELHPVVARIVAEQDAKARARREEREASGVIVATPVVKRAHAPGKQSATAIVREIMRSMKGASKADVVAACVAAGVKEITAKTRFGDELRAGIWND